MGSVESCKFNILDINQERLTLPHLRDPNTKIGIFQILKDLIGKDLSKISLPVYFNEPLSITQKAAESSEYAELAERAAKEPNQYKRIALLAAFNGSRISYTKNRNLKPFNSLLGETYEIVTSKYRMITEQVGHHPPITAYFSES